MKIIARIGGRWKNCRDTNVLFEVHQNRISKRLPLLAEAFKFRPPCKLWLRPFYFKGKVSRIYGRAKYSPGKGFSILLSVPDCLALPDLGLWVVDHEMAHIAAAIKYHDWTHSDVWRNVYETCRKIQGVDLMQSAQAENSRDFYITK